MKALAWHRAHALRVEVLHTKEDGAFKAGVRP